MSNIYDTKCYTYAADDLKRTVEIRPELLAFAYSMEIELRRNEHKGDTTIVDAVGCVLACKNNIDKVADSTLPAYNQCKNATDAANYAFILYRLMLLKIR